MHPFGGDRKSDPMSLDRILEGHFRRSASSGEPPPSILYHYTTWTGAEGILSSQRFWATAHDCTNDPAELVSANDAILGAVADLRASCTGYIAKVMRGFEASYEDKHISKSGLIYLACFSAARDDANQWRRYGDQGRGVCLG